MRRSVEVLFYQYVNLLEKQGETDHETIFVDGTKLESCAGRYTFCWRGSVEKHLGKVRGKVLELTGLKKLETLDLYLEQRKENIAFVYGKSLSEISIGEQKIYIFKDNHA